MYSKLFKTLHEQVAKVNFSSIEDPSSNRHYGLGYESKPGTYTYWYIQKPSLSENSHTYIVDDYYYRSGYLYMDTKNKTYKEWKDRVPLYVQFNKGSSLNLCTLDTNVTGYLTDDLSKIQNYSWVRMYYGSPTLTSNTYGGLTSTTKKQLTSSNSAFTRKMKVSVRLSGERIFSGTTTSKKLYTANTYTYNNSKWVKILTANNKLFAIANNEVRVSSDGGTTWKATNINPNNTATNTISRLSSDYILYANNKYVALGDIEGTNSYGDAYTYYGVIYSTDGITWNSVILSPPSGKQWLVRLDNIRWSGTHFITVSKYFNSIYYSTDAINWTRTIFKDPANKTTDVLSSYSSNDFEYCDVIVAEGRVNILATKKNYTTNSEGATYATSRNIYVICSSDISKTANYTTYTITTNDSLDGSTDQNCEFYYWNNKYIIKAYNVIYQSNTLTSGWTKITPTFTITSNNYDYSFDLSTLIYTNGYYIVPNIYDNLLYFSTDLATWKPFKLQQSAQNLIVLNNKLVYCSIPNYYNSNYDVYMYEMNISELKEPQTFTNETKEEIFYTEWSSYKYSHSYTTDDFILTLDPTGVTLKNWYSDSSLKNRTKITSMTVYLYAYISDMEKDIIYGNTDNYTKINHHSTGLTNITFSKDCAIRVKDYDSLENMCVY